MKVAVVCANGKALAELRERNDVQWTFISPAGDFQAEGEKTKSSQVISCRVQRNIKKDSNAPE